MILFGDILEFIIECIWFMVPSYVSVIVPVFVRKINFLNFPLNEKLFGKNKTYRGFFVGILFSILVAYFQYKLYINNFLIRAISIIFYDRINIFLFGFLMGFGSLFGDLIKSFFKRRLKIKEGKDWIPFDNLDYVIGSLFFVLIVFHTNFINFNLYYFFGIVFLSGLLHYFMVKIAYKLKIR
ncbi:MAG: CDP-archaeol synthase [Candidatus Woesearchaeota archaeon]